MIYKIKIKDKETGEENFIIMGDSYKPFKDHFINIVSSFTDKWHYESEDKYALCLGRTLKIDFLEIFKSKSKFVSFGGLKMAYEENYDKEVEQHNKKSYPPCKYLKDLVFTEDKKLLKELIKDNRILETSPVEVQNR